jgi:hypothetical protein
VRDRDELNDLTITSDKEMGRHFQVENILEIGVSSGVELIEKKSSHGVTRILARWQTNGVDHQNFRRLTGGSAIMIRRG